MVESQQLYMSGFMALLHKLILPAALWPWG